MKKFATCLGLLCLLLMAVSCTSRTEIKRVREIPIKTTSVPSYETGLYRTQVSYVMHGAMTASERVERLGQYYFVTWDDAHPEQPVELVMNYQQSATGSKVLQKIIRHSTRSGRGSRKDVFMFTGQEYFELGDVLAWRIDLKVGGQTVSRKRSFLWRDDYTTSRTEDKAGLEP